jgi:hypothetical protein
MPSATSQGTSCTHVGKYQGRIAAAAILGSPARANYEAIPRCVYTSPEIAAAGKTRQQAADAGIDVVTGHVDFHEITRPAIYCKDEATGAIELLADRASGTIVGGWIVGPTASEMIGFLTSAIRAQTPIETLLDVIQPYPVFGEGFYVALDRIARARYVRTELCLLTNWRLHGYLENGTARCGCAITESRLAVPRRHDADAPDRPLYGRCYLPWPVVRVLPSAVS